MCMCMRVCDWVSEAWTDDLFVRRPIREGGNDRASGAGPSDVAAVTLTELLPQHGTVQEHTVSGSGPG